MEKAVRRGVFGGRTMLAACLAVSLALPGCAGNGNGDDDMTGALLLGAAVIGLGVLAATAGDDDGDRDYERDRRHHRRGGYDSGYRQGNGYYGNRHGGRGQDGYSRYAGNGQCDDARYRTSNGGRAKSGTDERDCRRFGDGRK